MYGGDLLLDEGHQLEVVVLQGIGEILYHIHGDFFLAEQFLYFPPQAHEDLPDLQIGRTLPEVHFFVLLADLESVLHLRFILVEVLKQVRRPYLFFILLFLSHFDLFLGLDQDLGQTIAFFAFES